MYFFLFTTLSFLFSFKQIDNKKMPFLIFSALAFNLATMARYEAWFLIPILPIFLIKENKKYLFIFSFLSIIFPVIWMGIHYKLFGNPIKFYFWQTQNAREMFLAGLGLGANLNFSQRLFGWFWMLRLIFTSPVFWVGLFGLFCSILQGKPTLPFIFLITLSAMTIKAVNHTLPLGTDYAQILAIFFIIFIVYGIYNLLSKFRFKKVIFCGLTLYICVLWIGKAVHERPLFPPAQAALLDYLKRNLKDGDEIAAVNISEILLANLTRHSFSPRIY